jgi:hypothetical protein
VKSEAGALRTVIGTMLARGDGLRAQIEGEPKGTAAAEIQARRTAVRGAASRAEILTDSK